MTKEFKKLKQLINKEVDYFLEKRNKLDEEYGEDFHLYEGALEGLAIALMHIKSFEKILDEKKEANHD